MDAQNPKAVRRHPGRLLSALGAVAFAPVQAAYLVSLLGLVAALAVFRAFGPFRRRPDPHPAPASR